MFFGGMGGMGGMGAKGGAQFFTSGSGGDDDFGGMGGFGGFPGMGGFGKQQGGAKKTSFKFSWLLINTFIYFQSINLDLFLTIVWFKINTKIINNHNFF